ncbi:MAG: hypothetical protein MPJ50_12615 [Pirellulales bacterium]|nr:hypothetical protein [Pirellulales bacterium]
MVARAQAGVGDAMVDQSAFVGGKLTPVAFSATDGRTNHDIVNRAFCPGCARLLATPLAQQCFHCGLAWHNGEPRRLATEQTSTLSEGNPGDRLVTRRSWLRQFGRLLVATVAAQAAALMIIVLLFQEPRSFLLAMMIGVPSYLWLDVRLGRLADAHRWTASLGKLLALCAGILAIVLPQQFLPVVIGGLLVTAGIGWFSDRDTLRKSVIPVRSLILVASILAACLWLDVGNAVVGCLLATLSLLEFGSLMLALDAWEKRARVKV